MTDDSNSSEIHATNQPLAIICWTTTAILLSFLCLTQLGVMLCVMFLRAVLPFTAPLSIIVAIILSNWLARRAGLSGRLRWWPIALAVGAILISLIPSAAFYDLSWDGQWYHQRGVYAISQDWNPLSEPLRNFNDYSQNWVRHYAKGPWYIGASLTSLTGWIEFGKFITWPALVAALMAVTAAGLDAGLRRKNAFALGILVALNPVVMSEMLSYLVDGLMICFLACYVAALISSFHRPNALAIVTGIAAMICSINSKFTGLVFLCFVCAGVGLYCLIRRRDILLHYIGLNLLAMILGVVVWGYNPYVTNTLNRGNPFYPLMGSKEYPSLAARGQDPIELYETPHNMQNRNRFVRFGYALFGRPGGQPFLDGPDARLMYPFLFPIKDIALYRFHETRIAGFGPLFSGILLLSLILAVWGCMRSGPWPSLILLLSYLTLVTSLLISIHTWWARYGPQMWWFPILPIALVFWISRKRGPRFMAWILVLMLMINALLVSGVRFNWEVQATRTLRRQLTDLQNNGQKIEIDLRYFGQPVGERLKRWGIDYQRSRYQFQDGEELISVVYGYPGGIHYRFLPETSNPPQEN